MVAQLVENLPATQETWSQSISELGRSPGEGNGNPLKYSCLENHMDRGAWWATVHGVTKSHTNRLIYSISILFSFLTLLFTIIN